MHYAAAVRSIQEVDYDPYPPKKNFLPGQGLHSSSERQFYRSDGLFIHMINSSIDFNVKGFHSCRMERIVIPEASQPQL